MKLKLIGEGTLHGYCGYLLTTYFTDNGILQAFGMGLVYYIGNRVFHSGWEKRLTLKNNQAFYIWVSNGKYKILLIILLLVFVVTGTYYMTYLNYEVGQKLYTKRRCVLKEKPTTESKWLRELEKGEKMIYLDRSWRRSYWDEYERKNYNFWIKVRTSKKEIAWIYGAYLSENK